MGRNWKLWLIRNLIWLTVGGSVHDFKQGDVVNRLGFGNELMHGNIGGPWDYIVRDVNHALLVAAVQEVKHGGISVVALCDLRKDVE